MILSPQSPAHAADPAYEHLLERVRYDGAYPTRERAEQTVHTVLAALGRQLLPAQRAELVTCLPAGAAAVVDAAAPAADPLTGRAFVNDVAGRTGTGPAVARWDVGTVLSAVGRLAGEPLLSNLLRRLPPGYALLFGRAELTAQRAA